MLSFISLYYFVAHFPLRGSAKLSTGVPSFRLLCCSALSVEGECQVWLGRTSFFNVAILIIVAASSSCGEQHSSCVEDYTFLDDLYFARAHLR